MYDAQVTLDDAGPYGGPFVAQHSDRGHYQQRDVRVRVVAGPELGAVFGYRRCSLAVSGPELLDQLQALWSGARQ